VGGKRRLRAVKDRRAAPGGEAWAIGRLRCGWWQSSRRALQTSKSAGSVGEVEDGREPTGWPGEKQPDSMPAGAL
jgi:hypothetical protein